jgi:hypothetical protein
MSTSQPTTVTESLGGVAALGAEVHPTAKPVKIWAVVGGALLVLQLYVWTRWITGPYFERVPASMPCPNPLLPLPTKRSGYINSDGQLVLPNGVELPKTVPFERGK